METVDAFLHSRVSLHRNLAFGPAMATGQASFLDHEETVRAVAGQLVDQAEFPVEIALHGFARIVGTLVGATITVDGGRGLTLRPAFQRQSGIAPGVYQ